MPKRIPTYKPPHAAAGESRPNSGQRGYDRRWRKYRAWYLKANPLCVECLKQGTVRPAEHVDHVRPVCGGQADPLFWAEENHQALCASCHGRKTRAERGIGH